MSRYNDSNCRVFLGRLPYRIRESEIERFFKNYGRINDINVKTGFAFVVSTRLHFISIYFLRFFQARSLNILVEYHDRYTE
jgi:RNA recognition motif-containing protein